MMYYSNLAKIRLPPSVCHNIIRPVQSVPAKLDYNITLDETAQQYFSQMDSTKLRVNKDAPGIFNHASVTVPPLIQKNLYQIIDKEEFNMNVLRVEADKMAHFVRTRRLPWEEDQMKKQSDAVMLQVDKAFEISEGESEGVISGEMQMDIDAKKRKVWEKKMRQAVYNWKPLVVDTRHRCIEYALGRMALNHASISRILAEIVTRDPSFDPHYVLDFASGVGSNMIACLNSFKNVKEAMMVDRSADMNLLARDILLNEKREPLLDNLYFRLSLPASTDETYDLTMMSYNLLDMKSRKDRLSTLASLWQRTNGYLVIIENGTFAGFEAILEARDFLLKVGPKMPFQGVVDEPPASSVHVFSPCPHDLPCPRLNLPGTKTCRMITRADPLKLHEHKSDKRFNETYSYVVMKRVHRNEESDGQWPRVINEIFPARKFTNCVACCPDGCIKNLVMSPLRSGKLLYKYSKKVTIGDRLPLALKDIEIDHKS